MFWRKKVEEVNKIEKLVSEYVIWMEGILPCEKMKIRIYEDQDGTFNGCTDVRIKRKFDGDFEGSVGFGPTEEEALRDTIDWFLKMINEDYPRKDYPNGLSDNHIEHIDYSEF